VLQVSVWTSENNLEPGPDCKEDGKKNVPAKSASTCYTHIVFIFWNKLLCFWTLSIVLFLSKNTVLFIFQNTTFWRLDSVCLQVKPTQLGPIDRDCPYLQTPVTTLDTVYKSNTAQTICES
jgi:hypothetical protein